MADQQSHHAPYFIIYFVLCCLTLISALTDVVHIPSKALLIVIVFSVAAAKALFVMTYFMHLKFEGRWKYVLLTPTIILAMGLPMALMPDIGLHYYTVQVPQWENAEHASHDAPTDQPHTAPAEHASGH